MTMTPEEANARFKMVVWAAAFAMHYDPGFISNLRRNRSQSQAEFDDQCQEIRVAMGKDAAIRADETVTAFKVATDGVLF